MAYSGATETSVSPHEYASLRALEQAVHTCVVYVRYVAASALAEGVQVPRRLRGQGVAGVVEQAELLRLALAPLRRPVRKVVSAVPGKARRAGKLALVTISLAGTALAEQSEGGEGR